MAIQKQTHAEFKARLTSKLSKTRVPFSGTFELVSRCNFECVHCYLNDNRIVDNALDTTQVIDILDQLAQAGCLTLALTGGEPLLRKDYSEIHAAAHKMGFFISIFTNGSLIDEALVKLLAQYPPRVVEISLYGGDEKTYRAVTGKTGMFDKVIRGIDLLRKQKIPIVLKSVLIEPLLVSMKQMKKLASDRDLDIIFDPGINYTVTQNASPAKLRIDPVAAVELETSFPGKLRKLAAFHKKLTSMKTSHDTSICGAGAFGFHISETGHLMKCLMIREPSYSISEMSFNNAWQAIGNEPPPTFNKGSDCYKCDLKHLCGFCPGYVVSGEKTPVKGNSFHCFVAQQRLNKIKL